MYLIRWSDSRECWTIEVSDYRGFTVHDCDIQYNNNILYILDNQTEYAKKGKLINNLQLTCINDSNSNSFKFQSDGYYHNYTVVPV